MGEVQKQGACARGHWRCLVGATHPLGWHRLSTSARDLDRISVVARRLTSLTYFARWSEEGLDYGKDKATCSIR